MLSSRAGSFIAERMTTMPEKKGFMRLLFPAFLWMLLICFISAYAEDGSENLLYNGSFEILDEDRMPEGWFTDAYLMDPGYSIFQISDETEGMTSRAAVIHNTAQNDARFAQVVHVNPDSLYCLSGYVLAENVQEGHGANLSVEGVYAFSEKVYDTDGQWEYIEYYGETGPDQNTLTVFARVGGYSGMSKGTARFDDLCLKEVEAVPEGVIADRWFVLDYDDLYDGDDYDDEDGIDTTAGPAWPWITFAAVLYGLIFFAVICQNPKEENTIRSREDKKAFPIVPILLAALALRMILSAMIAGYSVDVNCFLSWGYTMWKNGPARFYLETSFCDYPPLYTYVLGFNSWFSDITGGGDAWTRMVFRFIPCVCDVAGCLMLVTYFRADNRTNRKLPGIVLALTAFNPAMILNSAAWGQMDSVLCMLLLAVAVSAVEGKWIRAIPLYVIAFLIKPQAFMLGFLGLTFIIQAAVKDRKTIKPILAGCGIGILLIAVCVIPFGVNQEFGWLIRKYTDTLSSYPYATVNTANFYYILGGNWKGITQQPHIAAPLLLAAAVLAHGIAWTKLNRNRRFYRIETAVSLLTGLYFLGCAFAGADWSLIGIGAMVYSFMIVISIAVRKGDIRILPYLGALLFILLYVFGIKMHERYLFPALFLLLFAWMLHRDRRILYLLILFTSTMFINEGIVLDNSIRLGASGGHLNTDTVWLADLLSILNILGAGYAVFLGYRLLHGSLLQSPVRIPTVLPVRSIDKSVLETAPSHDRKLHWNRRDTVLLTVITLLYSALCLTTLGSTKAPQTAWTSSSEEEEIVFDLQEYRDDIRILYFAQVSREDFTVSQSEDGILWDEETPAQMDQGQCWKWKYVTYSADNGDGTRTYYNNPETVIHFSGRYIRITSGQVGLAICEILFRDPDGNSIPAVIHSRTGENKDSPLYSDPLALLDEPDTLENLPTVFFGTQDGEAEPSWWNSTYFDEIYHARTGYEFLKGTVPYETSHPPLGKVFMSWCISIFGMTPFGWRFAGALAGIFMLPGLYLLGKQLTKRTWLAAISCLLMALDCMHLTQTQIATIDSFPVLFIIYAFFFMLRFIQTDLRSCPFRKILPSLALSGLFMGLSIASKWIGIYAGIGLAVLYFWHCMRFVFPRENLSGEERRAAWKKIIILSLWCVLFFILVPLIIYLLSYIPYMAYNNRIRTFGDYVDAVWRAQIGMLNYHSTPGLGMNHPFYSPWWQWPIIGKPMYYATEQYIASSAEYHHSIFCFGNPVVWWGALAALPAGIFFWIRRRHYRIEGTASRWHLYAPKQEIRTRFLWISLLAQYLPWVLVPRGTYIYHYFASVPFLILSIMICLQNDDNDRKREKIGGGVLCIAALMMFIIFLPYVTGMAAPKEWLDIGKSILRIWY